jgi:cyclopropane fatty-acyl-phospholipid synthase-like methyltransferase
MGTRELVVAVTIALITISGPLSGQQHQPAGKPDHMQHRFDDPAKFAKSFDDPKRDEWQMPSRVIEALGLKSGMVVADIGAGTGYFSMRLAKVSPGLTVYAADIEPKMVEHLTHRAAGEKLGNVTAVLAGPSSANLPKPVDVILIVDTYHHLGNRPAYFRELKKSLKPGGRIAIVDFRKDSPEGPPVEFRFNAEQIEAEMTQAGYALDSKHDFLPRQHYLIFR